ncbi:MAG: hypothetical protein C0507_08680 [Cyanobacteria bacterium PR.3.49]|nr:hypothetical protein [Cyanobacteria bacterium PR.3.49]
MASVNIAQTAQRAFLIAVTATAACLPAFSMSKQEYGAAIDKLFLNTQFNDAQQLCQKAIKELPKDKVFFLTKHGEMYIVATKGRSGLESAREAMRLAPKDPQVIATLSINEYIAGFVVKAEQLAQKAVELDAKNARAHAAMALSGLRDTAIPINDELDKALKLAPKDPISYIVAGTVHLRKLEYDQAESVYSRMVKAFPNTALPYYQRGYFRREVFNNNGALKDLAEVVKHYNKDHYVLMTRAKLNKKTGRHKDAIADFDALEKLGVHSYARRAECYAALNQYEQAIKDYKKALDEDGVYRPDFHQKYAKTMGSTRRSAWTQMMNGKDASELSDTKSCWLKMIILQQKHGDTDDALKEVTKFMTVFPGDLNSVYARHEIFKKKGRWVEALADISLLISKSPNVADYYADRADIFKHLNKPERAAEDLKRVHNLNTTGTVTGE